MGLLRGLLRPTQAPVAASSNINVLAELFADAISADAAKPAQQLAFLPSLADTPKLLADSRPRRVFGGSTRARRVQLNVRVSAERRAELRRYAKAHRLGIGEAVDLAIARLVAPQ